MKRVIPQNAYRVARRKERTTAFPASRMFTGVSVEWGAKVSPLRRIFSESRAPRYFLGEDLHAIATIGCQNTGSAIPEVNLILLQERPGRGLDLMKEVRQVGKNTLLNLSNASSPFSG